MEILLAKNAETCRILYKKPDVVALFYKKTNVPERAPLVPIKATFPFEMVSIDCLHLDRAKGGSMRWCVSIIS